MRPTILLFARPDGRFNMKFIFRAHVFVPTAAYFENEREAISYAVINGHLPLETFGVKIRAPHWEMIWAIVDGIQRRDGSITSEGKTFDVFYRRADQWRTNQD